ncbi:TIGR03809 family protein [Bradyrhizobium diazoefficiens]|nr:TIGR03809 family protein [Bradyrhizobium diazoefficiens]UCF53154.1 MAG: TIGR03809 family protein [Bradyrhizobium sp.]MBR0980467.1 TIGR03809 family protein [Bradyrhizobium diazoefficiens]MBR1009815.1 TIGR03809 family protein [Bradyrhizobium diazoefficiens]MBR1016398.1 TIGR03809 family protein [Bradyrhizobium diazoefficiens]
MTHRKESMSASAGASVRAAAVSPDIAARWCTLAERRLEHLSDMFETGRWRRYHSEIAFLENIQEAKRAVQAWRALATGEDVAAAAARVAPAFGWSPAAISQTAQTMQPKAVHIAPETTVPVNLDPEPDVLAEVMEAPLVPTAAPAAVALFTAPDVVAPLRAPAAKAAGGAPVVRPPSAERADMVPFTAPAVKPPVAKPAVMATLLPQFAPPAAEIVTAPERVVEFTFSLDGLEAKYPLLRNAF